MEAAGSSHLTAALRSEPAVRTRAVAYVGHGALGAGVECAGMPIPLVPAMTTQSAATAIGPEGVGLRTRKHSGISATQIQAAR